MARTPKSSAARKVPSRKSAALSRAATSPQSDAAETPSGGGRNANGTFARGNAFGPGNPHARACARMLAIFRNAISDEEMHRLFRVLFDKAEAGDVSAAKLILSYKVGKPLPAPNPDSIDRDEWEHYQQDVVDSEAMKHVLGSLPSRVGNDIARIGLPIIADARSRELAGNLPKRSPTPEPQSAIEPLDSGSPIANGDSVTGLASSDIAASSNEHPATADDVSSARRDEANQARSKPGAKEGQSARAANDSLNNNQIKRSQKNANRSKTKPIANGKKRSQLKKNSMRKSAKAMWLQPLARRLRDRASAGSEQPAKK